MPRNPRVQLENAATFVTNRAIEGLKIFQDKEDFESYIDLLAKYKVQHGFNLYAFALMPDQIQLLVEVKGDASLSEIMHNITSAFTKYFNKKYGRSGHLFRGRFRATMIEKDSFLLKLTRYVHTSPVRSGLALEPAQYLYSSVLYYVAAPVALRVDMSGDVQVVLGYLKGKSYAEYLSEDMAQDLKDIGKDLQRKMYLGSDVFGDKVREAIELASVKDGAVEDDEEEPVRPKLNWVVPVVSGVALAALAGSFLLSAGRKIERRASAPAVVIEPVLEENPVIPFEIVGLDGTAWQVKFVAGTPFQTVDTLTFKEGKMVSENLDLNGYKASNYSMTKETGRVIWETMQTSDAGTGSWRGEVEAGRMRGVLSLRKKEGEAQDFSFVSLKYIKIRSNPEVR